MTTQTHRSAWAEYPDYHIDIAPLNHRERIYYNKVVIADSDKILVLHEQGHAPVYYFPGEDIRTDLLSLTKKTSFCPFKGDAIHWSLVIGDKRIEIAAWSFKEPFKEVKQIKDYIAFYPEAIEELKRITNP